MTDCTVEDLDICLIICAKMFWFLFKPKTKRGISDKIFAQGTVSKMSRKIAFCEGKVLDTDGSILATGSGVFKLIRD